MALRGSVSVAALLSVGTILLCLLGGADSTLTGGLLSASGSLCQWESMQGSITISLICKCNQGSTDPVRLGSEYLCKYTGLGSDPLEDVMDCLDRYGTAAGFYTKVASIITRMPSEGPDESVRYHPCLVEEIGVPCAGGKIFTMTKDEDSTGEPMECKDLEADTIKNIPKVKETKLNIGQVKFGLEVFKKSGIKIVKDTSTDTDEDEGEPVL